MDLTEEQLHTLRHMLGINHPEHREPTPYRNHYAANPGDPAMLELEALGMVRLFRRADGLTSFDFYCCTEAGRNAALRSHRAIRLPKGKRLYRKFLDVSDCCPDLTFREFLTSPKFERSRREA